MNNFKKERGFCRAKQIRQRDKVENFVKRFLDQMQEKTIRIKVEMFGKENMFCIILDRDVRWIFFMGKPMVVLKCLSIESNGYNRRKKMRKIHHFY